MSPTDAQLRGAHGNYSSRRLLDFKTHFTLYLCGFPLRNRCYRLLPSPRLTVPLTSHARPPKPPPFSLSPPATTCYRRSPLPRGSISPSSPSNPRRGLPHRQTPAFPLPDCYPIRVPTSLSRSPQVHPTTKPRGTLSPRGFTHLPCLATSSVDPASDLKSRRSRVSRPPPWATRSSLGRRVGESEDKGLQPVERRAFNRAWGKPRSGPARSAPYRHGILAHCDSRESAAAAPPLIA
jgi:hypothetical protein